MEALLPLAQPSGLYAAFGPKQFGFGDPRFASSLSSPNLLTNGDDLFYGYSTSSPFVSGYGRGLSTPSPRAASLSRGSSDSDSVIDDGDDAAAAAEHRLRLARLALQYQEVASRYELCLTHLADASDEAAALRRENEELRVANGDLARCIAMVGGKQSSALALADELRGLHLADEQAKAMPPPLPPPPPAAQMLPLPPGEKHAMLPKSISVRSTGYLKMNQNGKHRVSKPTNVGSRVFVGMDGAAKGEEHKGGKEKKLNGGLEFEVYNQGMLKTELCNKWEETSACPYGDQCQFAHGIAELRPVIRHPRYKTEVCRMVLAGDVCPYGHRCHFRHSITPADRRVLRP
ncbi:zinc finger CCCH domain-containing protein 39-like isoform X2 [Phragmites australis]|uniref:zinc finger CCCH domain-containing protein 39-like isoform X2 n=1 Tax=Phragmites australis TaxID=29695 RepID=UPI002D798780|nr:zinc finger CCCH domain-containing protein 39-like isoform X2 [Phragmites australis]